MAFWSEVKRHFYNLKVELAQKGWKVFKDGTRAYFEKGSNHHKWAGLHTPPEGGATVIRPVGLEEYWRDGILEQIVQTSPLKPVTIRFKTRQAYAPDEQYQGMRLPDVAFYEFYSKLFLEGVYYKDGSSCRHLQNGWKEIASLDGTVSLLFEDKLHSPNNETPARIKRDGTRQWFDMGVLKKEIDPTGTITTFIWNSSDTRVLYKEITPSAKEGVRYLYDGIGNLAAMSYPDGTRIPLAASGPVSGYGGRYAVNTAHLFSGMSYVISPDMRTTTVFNDFGKRIASLEHNPLTNAPLKRVIFDQFGMPHDILQMASTAQIRAGAFIRESLAFDGKHFPHAALSTDEELKAGKPYTYRRYSYARTPTHPKQFFDCQHRIARLQVALGDELLDMQMRLYGLDRVVNWRGSLTTTGLLAAAAARTKGPKPSAG